MSVKVGRNEFYKKKVANDMIQVSPRYSDLPASTGDTIKLSAKQEINFAFLDVSKPETPSYGDSTLKGAFLQLYSGDVETDNQRQLGNLHIYRGNPDLSITEGGFSFAKKGTTSTVVGNKVSVYSVKPQNGINLINEQFDGNSVNAGTTLQRVGMNSVTTYSRPYILLGDLGTLINTRDGTQTDFSSSTFQGSFSNIIETYSSGGDGLTNQAVVYFIKDVGGNITGFYVKMKRENSTNDVKDRIGIDNPFPYVAPYSNAIQYLDATSSTVDLDNAPPASKINTLFDDITLTRDSTNVFSDDAGNPVVLSTAELSTEASENDGQSLRLYHLWNFSENNQNIQNLFGERSNLNPQVARAYTQIPFPPVPFDIARDKVSPLATTKTFGNRRGVVPEIDINMKISKLEPTLIVDAQATADLAAKGFFGNTNITNGQEGTEAVTLLRSVTITFSNYKPREDHTTLDKFLNFGMEGFYQSQGRIVGGVTFFKTGINGTPKLVSASGNSIIAMPLPSTTIPQGTAGTDLTHNTVMKEGGMARLTGSAGASINNSLDTIILGNLPQTTTSSNTLNDTKMPQFLELPANTFMNMRIFMDSTMYNSTGTASRNPYSGSNAYGSAGTDDAKRGSCMRIYFNTDQQTIGATGSTGLNFLDIPFPAKTGIDEVYNWNDNKNLFPEYMTVWVQNYPWVSTANASYGSGFFPQGDNQVIASGASREVEVFIDRILYKNFTPAITNATSSGVIPLTAASYASPMQTAVSGANYNHRWQYSAGSLEPIVDNRGGGLFTTYDVGQNICFGFNDANHWATTGSKLGEGYFLFNNFSSSDYKSVSGSAIGPVSTLKSRFIADSTDGTVAGAMYTRTTVKAADGSADISVPLGGQMMTTLGATYVSGGTAATQFDVVSGSTLTVSNGAIADNQITLTTGANTFRSTDGLRQKGFAHMRITGTTTYDNWAVDKMENILVSTKIVDTSTINPELQEKYGPCIKVQNTSIFNLDDEDETVRIYMMGSPRANAHMKTGLVIDTKVTNTENVLTFTADDLRADDNTTELLSQDNLPFLWIGPEKHWITMLLDSPSSLAPRKYSSVCQVDETPNDGTTAQLGTTFNEWLYNYDTSVEGTPGKSGRYLKTWDLTNTIADDSFLILNEDNGFGAFNPEDGTGGEVAVQKIYYDTYNYVKIDSLASKPLNPGESFPLYLTYTGVNTVESQTISTDNETTTPERKPTLYWKYEDLPPVITNLSVGPAVDLLSTQTNLYNLETENLNAVKFNWTEENADDVWYRMLILGEDEAINDKYHNAIMWLPLNEVPNTPEDFNFDYVVHKPTAGTSGNASVGATVRGVLDGQAGYAAQLTNAANGKVTVANGTNSNLSGLDEFTLVIHWTPSTADAGNTAYIATATNSIGTAANNFELFKNTSDKIQVKLGANIDITGNKFIECNDDKPVSIILTYYSGSSSPVKAKLYLDGVLAGSSTGQSNVASGRDFVVGGVYDASYRGSTGKFEEILIYNKAYPVVETANEYIYSTVDTLDITGTRDIVHSARLIAADYHNIRGKNPREIGMSNITTWEATTL